MADVFDTTKRSEIMSNIRSKDTKPEILLRKALFARGFRYRLYVKDLAGKPDIVLPKFKTVVFIHGCFWHGHENCKRSNIPKSNTTYWDEKILRNKARDEKNASVLRQNGWKVIVVWECEISKKSLFPNTIERLEKEIKTNLR